MTLGIAQIETSELISDQESIRRMASLMHGTAQFNFSNQEIQAAILAYNQSQAYVESINAVHKILMKMEPR